MSSLSQETEDDSLSSPSATFPDEPRLDKQLSEEGFSHDDIKRCLKKCGHVPEALKTYDTMSECLHSCLHQDSSGEAGDYMLENPDYNNNWVDVQHMWLQQNIKK